ncbi:MAG: hypothetical protein FWD36_07730 [Treponema sp.]|nr:hypothetical protein [Treponema sp.]
MSISDSTFNVLNEKHGFAPEQNDTSSTYNELIPGKAWFYFGKEDANGGPYMGFWVDEKLEQDVRKVLKDSLHTNKDMVNGGDVIEDGCWIYCVINKKDDPALIASTLLMMKAGIFEYYEDDDESEDDDEEDESEDEDDDTEENTNASNTNVQALRIKEPARAKTPSTVSGKALLHTLRIMFGNNYGIIPRRSEFGPYSWENISGKPSLLWRFLLLLSYVWIVPGIIVLFIFLPYTKYFFVEPKSITIEPDKANVFVLPEDVTYAITDFDGEPVSNTISAGTVVYPAFRVSWHTYAEDEKGNRFNIDAHSNGPTLGNNKHLEDFPSTWMVIYSEKDIERFFIGKTLDEVKAQYAVPMPVIVLEDGSMLAQFGGLSTRNENKKRLSGLTVKTDTSGIIREYTFTEETKIRANLIDWIPFVNKIVETDGIRKFIRGFHSSSSRIQMDRNPIVVNGLSFGDKWYQILGTIFLLFSLMTTVLAPAILIPVFICLLLFIANKTFSAEKIFQIGSALGFFVLLPLAFFTSLILETPMAGIMIGGTLFFCYIFFIPELKSELTVLRCDMCAGWDTYYFVEVIERIEYKDTKITKYKSGREDKEVSYRVLTKRKYRCNHCGDEIIKPSWKR